MNERTPGIYPGTTGRDKLPERSTDIRVLIEPEAMPNYRIEHNNWPKLDWSGSIDDLVRFVYANQTVLFAEDAVLFDYNGEFILKRDPGLRIKGSWEDSDDQDLRNAARKVIANWSSGRLDEAVNELQDALGEER